MKPCYSSKETNTPHLDDYRIIDELGSGAFGSVFKVMHKQTSTYYVIKKVSLGHLPKAMQQEAFLEVKMLHELTHPNIIQYITCFIQSQQLYIVTECADKGDLQKV